MRVRASVRLPARGSEQRVLCRGQPSAPASAGHRGGEREHDGGCRREGRRCLLSPRLHARPWSRASQATSRRSRCALVHALHSLVARVADPSSSSSPRLDQPRAPSRRLTRSPVHITCSLKVPGTSSRSSSPTTSRVRPLSPPPPPRLASEADPSSAQRSPSRSRARFALRRCTRSAARFLSPPVRVVGRLS